MADVGTPDRVLEPGPQRIMLRVERGRGDRVVSLAAEVEGGEKRCDIRGTFYPAFGPFIEQA